MGKDLSLHEDMNMPDPNFPVKLNDCPIAKTGEVAFDNHWHEEIEFLYFENGSAIIECNFVPIHVQAGDLIVVNSNDAHGGVSLSDDLTYHCIIMDTSLLYSKSINICETKYLTPIVQNRIVFKNKISNDLAVTQCINSFVKEYKNKEHGYELALKASMYQLLVLLLRYHVEKMLTPNQYSAKVKNLQRLDPVFGFIDEHFNEKLSLEKLCSIANMSKYHFCRQFKEITGKTLSDYINNLRVDKANYLIKNSDLNITEIGLNVGFNDLNYFSRVFKKIKKVSPSQIRHSEKKYL